MFWTNSIFLTYWDIGTHFGQYEDHNWHHGRQLSLWVITMILILSLKKLGKDTFKLRPDNRFITFTILAIFEVPLKNIITAQEYSKWMSFEKNIWFAIFSTYMLNCSCFILCQRGQTCRLVPQKGGGNWLLREERVRRRGHRPDACKSQNHTSYTSSHHQRRRTPEARRLIVAGPRAGLAWATRSAS